MTGLQAHDLQQSQKKKKKSLILAATNSLMPRQRHSEIFFC